MKLLTEGEVKIGKEIGKPDKGRRYIWHACIDCGKKRWLPLAPLLKGHRKGRCPVCSSRRNVPHGLGKYAPRWNGGKFKNKDGYVSVLVPLDDFFHAMATKQGYVLEHRLVMAKHLKRCLLSWEIVHHKNGIRDDNRIENLLLLPSQSYHRSGALLIKRIKLLEKRVTLLEAENALLKAQVEVENATYN